MIYKLHYYIPYITSLYSSVSALSAKVSERVDDDTELKRKPAGSRTLKLFGRRSLMCFLLYKPFASTPIVLVEPF